MFTCASIGHQGRGPEIPQLVKRIGATHHPGTPTQRPCIGGVIVGGGYTQAARVYTHEVLAGVKVDLLHEQNRARSPCGDKGVNHMTTGHEAHDQCTRLMTSV